jgi:hypothetical protein
MSPNETVIEGTLKPDGTLELDEKPNLPPGRVQVVLRQEIEATKPQPLGDEFFRMMEEIWAAQKARGHVPRSVEEVEAQRRELRGQVEDEIDAAIRLQEECRRRRKQAESETTTQ